MKKLCEHGQIFEMPLSVAVRLMVFDAQWNCIRHDIPIRLIGAEHFLKTGDIGELYRQLAWTRSMTIPQHPTGEDQPERFPALLESMRKSGYLKEFPVFIDTDFKLIEGSHRIAGALALNLPGLSLQVRDDLPPSREDGDWFKKYFSLYQWQKFMVPKIQELRLWCGYRSRETKPEVPPDRTPDTEEPTDKRPFVRKAADPSLRFRLDSSDDPWKVLKERMAELEYPPNHIFDPQTLEPCGQINGTLGERVRCLKKHAPELFLAGGESFLDIGCSKGWFCLSLASKYNRIVGYDPDERYVEFCTELARLQEINNVEFHHGCLNEIPNVPFETVYAGHLHHHLFAQEVEDDHIGFFFLEKLAKLTKSILILDGPFDFSDVTLKAISKDWNEGIKTIFTVSSFVEKMRTLSFELIRRGESGSGPREALVFRRRA